MKAATLAILSLVPPVALVAIGVLEPIALRSSLDRETISSISDLLLLFFGVLAIVMVVFYTIFTIKSDDPRFNAKKTFWVAILLFCNVCALPVFWFIFFAGEQRESKVPGSH